MTIAINPYHHTAILFHLGVHDVQSKIGHKIEH